MIKLKNLGVVIANSPSSILVRVPGSLSRGLRAVALSCVTLTACAVEAQEDVGAEGAGESKDALAAMASAERGYAIGRDKLASSSGFGADVRATPTTACKALAAWNKGPFPGSHPLFFYGFAGQATAVATAKVGMDLVYDLSAMQAAGFTYGGAGLAYDPLSLQLGAYAGAALTTQPGVISAWSGKFATLTTSTSVGVLVTFSGSLAAFSSPDRSTVGLAAGGAAGLAPIAVPVTVAADLGGWVPSPTLTATNIAAPNRGSGRDQYVQFDSSLAMGLNLLSRVPNKRLGATVGVAAIAWEALRKAGVKCK